MKGLIAATALLCVAFSVSLVVADNLPMVSTKLGLVRGRRMTFSSKFLKETGEVDAYQGIPFAKPPVNDRRFQLPEAVDPWEGVVNATTIPPSCPQIIRSYYQQLYGTLNFSEDCLYLNVFVPREAPPNATVMVYIHGGSFTFGSGSDLPYSSIPLASLGEVILVTINYRLNIFGFFSTGDEAIPANLALTDQRIALKWINENIQAFGGDPRKVTVFGQSAGAASIGWHLLSNESRQYFQRAVLQSGSPTAVWATVYSPEASREMASLVAVVGGCSPEDTNVIADCLREKTVEELLKLHNQIDEIYQGQLIWLPTNDGVFFTDDVNTLISEGDYSDVDIMIGTTKNEGTFLTWSFTGLPQERPFVTKDFLTFITTRSNDSLVSDLIEAVYSSGIGKDDNYVGALEEALGDISFKCAASLFARTAATAGSTVYMYEMAHEPIRSVWNVTWLRASHSEDLQFVFGLPFFNHSFYTPVYDEVKISFYVMRMWTNFAKSGNPNIPEPLPRSIPEWPQFVPGVEEYKELDIKFANNRKLRQHQCNFWINLLPQIAYLKGAVAGNDGQ